MLMTAIKDHGYCGRRIKAGKDYEVRSVKDAAVLQAAGLARQAKPRLNAEPSEPLRSNAKHIQARESLPLNEEEPRELSGEDEEISYTKDDLPKTQRRRRYRRNDMVPEE